MSKCMSSNGALTPSAIARWISQKEAFIFDMDGVLIDTKSIHENAYKYAFGKLAERFNYGKYMGMSTRGALEKFLSHEQTISFLKVEKQLHALEHGNESPIYPSVKNLLALLSYHGKKIAVATSASRERTLAQLRAHQIDNYFKIIITTDEVSAAKPSPDLYLTAQKAIGITPEKTIIIEDAPSGILSAHAAGIESIGLLHTYNEEELRGATLILRDIHSVYALLNYQLNQIIPTENIDSLKRRVCAIIPAAGEGTRLGFDKPKILYPFGGKSALEIVYHKVLPIADKIIIITNLKGESGVRETLAAKGLAAEIIIDPSPYGTAGSISLALEKAKDYDDVLILWGDQIGMSRESLNRIVSMHQKNNADLSIPTLLRMRPYIHLDRDYKGKVIDVYRRLFNDPMPQYGENDSGVFVINGKNLYETLSKMKEDYLKKHDVYLQKQEKHEEFDFLDIIAEISAKGGKIVTSSCIIEEETIGYNTLEEAKFHEERILSGKHERYY